MCSPSSNKSPLRSAAAYWARANKRRGANGTKRLNLVILRPAMTYGPYDTKAIAKSIVLARIYQSLNEELKWLWTKDVKMNTVHVEDVARAAVAAAQWLANGKAGWDASTYGATPVFNLVDHSNTDQGQLAEITTQIFGIKSSFAGSILSAFAKLNMDNVLEDVNEHVMGPWAELLESAAITRPGPLNPFMEKEQVKDEDLCLDGGLFEKTVGFEYKRPKCEKKEVEEMIESYKAMKWWP